jgi:hypothetical protein
MYSLTRVKNAASAKKIGEWADRLAASAQVREAEPLPDNREMIRELNYSLWMTGNGGCEPPQEWQDKWHAEHPEAPEPVPVAQPSADGYIGIACDYRDGILDDREMRRAMAAEFADHARRVAELELALDIARSGQEHATEKRHEAEASLAACREGTNGCGRAHAPRAACPICDRIP